MTGGTSGFGAITAQRLRGASDVRLTTSGAHDPATGAGLTQPRHADAELLAHPDRDPASTPGRVEPASTPTPHPGSAPS